MNAHDRTAISQLFERPWDRHYSSTKLRTDPLYSAVLSGLAGSRHPLLDLGCGIGLLAFVLRSEGIESSVTGVDYDHRKIATAKLAVARSGWKHLDFSVCDARQGIPEHCGDVSILDILQFFTPTEQEHLLRSAAERVAVGGKLIVRTGLRDGSWRFRATVVGDVFAKGTLWMKAAPVHYPETDDFYRVLADYGQVQVTPLWGGTPFNNHLVVMERM